MLKTYKLSLSEDTLSLTANSNLRLKGKYARLIHKNEQKELWKRIELLDFSTNQPNPVDGGRLYIIKYTRGKENYSKIMTTLVPKPDREFINFIEMMVINAANWEENK